MLDVLLVNLPIQTYKTKRMVGNYDFSPSLGLMYLYGSLTLNGYKAEIVDLVLDPMKKSEFIKKVESLNPAMLGISVYTENIQMAIKLAKSVKEVVPQTKIALGGPHVSLSLKEFEECDSIDFAMKREGEASIVELITAVKTYEKLIRYDDIEGIAFRRDGKVTVNPEREFIKALDILPVPPRDYFGLEKFRGNKAILISTSRGCPNRCIYCSASALSGKKYRVRDIENVYLEVVMLQNDIGHIPINIVDDSFTVLKTRVYRFLELIKEHHGTFPWECESIVVHMNEELLQKMKECNLVAIQYGVESGNQHVIDSIMKGIDLKYLERIAKETNRLGIIPILSFMFGHYCETEQTAQDTIEFMKKAVNEFDAQVVASLNTPFPGTYQYEHAKELGMKITSDDYRLYTLLNPIVETENFNADDQINWMYQITSIQNRKGFISDGINSKFEKGQ